ncbi:hypothetical protein HISP_16345 [Haloarcula hispanica N601]|uniref:DUF6884 domain-containing protein n=2 Tax=Haloarcula hispanica TaxID=51589 RepID=V5TR81_HALHI|nr:DUF6884 domain-containing protein [Haloarcula hispanica]AEM58778.1 conserved hypothetical protein [Haloarcula hispanica ATCC 33960]AHB67618.1 hypothetical protein HISP_16345 [Haloarcula hispanica N601]
MTTTQTERTRGRFVLIGCGNAKTDDPAEARDLYTSSYFAVKRSYAEAAVQWARTADRRANTWAVLSAEHGILMPRQTVAPYDTTIEDLRGEPIEGEANYRLPSGDCVESRLDRWALRVHSSLGDWLRRPYAADQQESPCRELVVLAGSDYVDALRKRGIFDGRPTAIRTGRETYTALPPKATVRFPFQERDFDGMFDQMSWLSDRVEELSSAAAPARRSELSAFDGGFERDSATWQTGHSGVDVEGTEQAGLDAFENVPERFLATRQTSLATDGGEGEQGG